MGCIEDVDLDEARKKVRKKYRNMAFNDLDPMGEHNRLRQEAGKAQQESPPTFITCAARYIRVHRHSWSNAKHARQWVGSFKIYARPIIGHKPVEQITTNDILAIIQPIWYEKNETAKRVQRRIENILNYSAAHNYRNTLNPTRWHSLLDYLVTEALTRSRVKKIRHHPTIYPIARSATSWLNWPTRTAVRRERCSL
ncbi:MAG: hypothetical protein KZQ66_02370 [Candidatus Thiodiazotropha sp. (ex Lucinoma aequizonata)]|nr:hypothetical protein [Candidatus Thiodiazotropha sp. (ex Lucinoma aequizonata)]MCU7893562.1 hypothetical protein [Candidatus Thiodiazotropha sp. (ex Lucinoma aequizonata)]MCU7900992.1 hypothetical protein [Candidatus Thiodiazotropha sp. (ex Lucinoma aequizonata)]MCU7910380.1 hypothetical protein [Candidatus Thiodiazotropha sp. (ex Lucinoma aequizonata)]MCU7911390.1 hypothetical protein [Candidatus Thiodiazotropha sp. (ex Lucinoma aequizonata)]